MKKISVVIIALIIASSVFAEQFENPMLNMTVPSGLEEGQAYFVLNHKFLTTLKDYPKDDLFAIFDGGVNMNLDFRYMTPWNVELKAGYTTKNREQTAGLSYVLKTPKLFFNSQIDVQFFTYKDYVHNNFDQNLFYLLSLQSIPLFDDRVVFSVDAAYDGYNETIGLGIATSLEVLRHISLLGEYYPLIKNSNTNPYQGNTGCYSFGLKVDTFGHQFIFKAGNSSDTGTRRMMLGTNTQNIFIGFTIMRLIAF